MSIDAITWAINQENALGITKLVLFVIAYHANNEGFAWPSTKTLAKKCGVSQRTVIRATEELVKLGLLEKNIRLDEYGRQTSNGYKLTGLFRGDNMTPYRDNVTVMRANLSGEGVKKSHTGVTESHPLYKEMIDHKENNITPKAPLKSGSVDKFSKFWHLYPSERLSNENGCRRHWRRHHLDTIANVICADIRKRKKCHADWLNDKILKPLNYLKQEGWKDAIRKNKRKDLKTNVPWAAFESALRRT